MKVSGNYCGMNLTPMQKRAVMKIAVDLAKADKQIHADEVTLLNDYRRELGLADDELQMIHYLSLQECVEVLSVLDAEVKSLLIAKFEKIVEVDVDIDPRERILLATIRMALTDDSRKWTRVFSVIGVEAECSSSQIVYLERKPCPGSSKVLNDPFNNLLLSKALNDVGLQLFYLPKVKQKLDVELLRGSMEYILPSGKAVNSENLTDSLNEITSVTLFNAFCSTFRLSPGMVGFDAFLMMKLQESEVLNDEGNMLRSMDFICIDVADEIKDRVTRFVTELDAPARKLSYDGYYRLLYDHLMASSAVKSSVRIDFKGDFYLSDAQNQKLTFESSPQSKTFYLLLLRYGVSGVAQSVFEAALEYLETVKSSLADTPWNYETFQNGLDRADGEHVGLIRRIISIYDYLSTKDPANEGFLNYIINIIRHRSTLKNYINNGFRSAAHLADKDSYYVQFNQESKSYVVPVDISLFSIEEDFGKTVSLIDCRLWRTLLL